MILPILIHLLQVMKQDYKQLDSPLQVPYNLTKIPRYALELVRGDISSNLSQPCPYLALGFEGYGPSYS